MGIQQFSTIMVVWDIVFIVTLFFCIIYAIVSLKKNRRRFILPYALEAVTVVGNLVFMYIIDHGYVDYGDDKFSGLSAMGDWFGFGVLILITLIPVVTTVICNMVYIVKNKKQINDLERGI